MVATRMKPRALVANENDTVATLLDPVVQGESVMLLDPDLGSVGAVESRSAIESFHKVAIREIAQGEPVIKLGEVIGRASRPIARGDHVHVHNVVSARVAQDSR